jgi:hypothetical protein
MAELREEEDKSVWETDANIFVVDIGHVGVASLRPSSSRTPEASWVGVEVLQQCSVVQLVSYVQLQCKYGEQ